MYFREGYTTFPYRPSNGSEDCQNPTPNAGGIDLVNYPEKIDEIQEIAQLPELKTTLIELNKSESPFVTLGCTHWINKINHSHFSYLEFTFKDNDKANNFEFFISLEKAFKEFIVTLYPDEVKSKLTEHLQTMDLIYYRKIFYFERECYLLGATFETNTLIELNKAHKDFRQFLIDFVKSR